MPKKPDSKKPPQELTDEDLDDVAGGGSLSGSTGITTNFETAFGGEFLTFFGGGSDLNTVHAKDLNTADVSGAIKGTDQLKR